MAELTEQGYQTFRDYVDSSVSTPNSWGYIEIYDDNSNPVTRVDIVNDSRSEWVKDGANNTLKIKLSLSGGDDDIDNPVTVKESAIWTANPGGIQVTEKETFAEASLGGGDDTVNITHIIKVPQ